MLVTRSGGESWRGPNGEYTLTLEHASVFASLALAHVGREYPNKLDHVLLASGDVQSPRALHPVFFGSYDWHSCVHGYWLLARLYRRFPGLPEGATIRALFADRFTAANLATEASYAAHPARSGFERPYGWAWMLMLAAELNRHHSVESTEWAAALTPLARVFEDRLAAYLPKATYPVRVGTHFNSAFAVRLALEYAASIGNSTLTEALRDTALRWYEGDRDCQAWEPSGDDFLSSALIEAECMRCVMPQDGFAKWRDAFLPHLVTRKPETLFSPAFVSDRTDGKIAHLDGLNLSRAWCWRSLAMTWPADDPRRVVATEAATRHLASSLPHVMGDYMGEHWLATFALLALDSLD